MQINNKAAFVQSCFGVEDKFLKQLSYFFGDWWR